MHTVVLKQWNESVVVEVPADLLEQLHAVPGQAVTMRVEEAGLALGLCSVPKRGLRELLERCDFSLPMTGEEQEWASSPAVGREAV